MYNYFDKEWFKKHQSKLLWLLRFSLFRRILRIETDKPIIKIEPNSYTVFLEDNGETWKVQTDFRTHWKYSKRLYYAFKPLWYAFHVWDMIINPLVPQWNLGFDTLTKYPDPDPETSTVDGTVWQVYSPTLGVSWSTLRSDSGNGFTDNASSEDAFLIIADATTNTWRYIRRSIFLFDTSSLGSSVTVDSAVLSLKGNGTKTDGLAITPNCNIYSANPASNTALANSDYSTLGTTAYATAVAYSSLSTSAYTDFTFNATGIANVSKTGVSKFGARNGNYDADNVEPTWSSGASSRWTVIQADWAGTASDPKLVVTYSAPPLAFSIANPQIQGVKIINN